MPWTGGASSASGVGCHPCCLSLPHLSLVPAEEESSELRGSPEAPLHTDVFRIAGERERTPTTEGHRTCSLARPCLGPSE